jgi:hypothetical protein
MMIPKQLPKIKHAIFEATLPSTNNKVKYRAFTVKEEKILLIAKESNDIAQAMLSIKQVINNCLIDANVEQLSLFDVEYLLLALRSKSVDNEVAFSIVDPDTSETIQLHINLDQVIVNRDPTHTRTIDIGDDMTLVMRYPTVDEFSDLMVRGIQDQQANFDMMVRCMEQLISGDEVFLFSEFDQKQIEEFVEDLSGDAIKRIKRFFETMPVLRHEVPYKDNTGKSKTFVVEGMTTFFQ